MTPDQDQLVRLVIERAQSACDRALKHQNFDSDTDKEFVSGWQVAVHVCKMAIEMGVLDHIEKDLADTQPIAATDVTREAAGEQASERDK